MRAYAALRTARDDLSLAVIAFRAGFAVALVALAPLTAFCSLSICLCTGFAAGLRADGLAETIFFLATGLRAAGFAAATFFLVTADLVATGWRATTVFFATGFRVAALCVLVVDLAVICWLLS